MSKVQISLLLLIASFSISVVNIFQYSQIETNVLFLLWSCLLLLNIAAILLILMIVLPTSFAMLWITIIGLGFTIPPLFALCIQWISLATDCTETSMIILIVGIYAGIGFVPSILSVDWSDNDGHRSIFRIGSICIVISVPLLILAVYLSYNPEIKRYFESNPYQPVPSH
jgi:hypothetical protein